MREGHVERNTVQSVTFPFYSVIDKINKWQMHKWNFFISTLNHYIEFIKFSTPVLNISPF